MTLRLSKSRYTLGLRCPRLLWWTVHEPEAPELVPGPELETRFAWGHRVGEAARRAYPGGVLVPRARGRLAEAVESTASALASGAKRIYEAAFWHGSVFVAVDVLDRGRRGWVLREVKSTTQVKQEHLPDAAVQAWVVQGAGLRVDRVDLVHLNRACTYPRLEDLFTEQEVTDEVASRLPGIASDVERLLGVLAGPLPEARTGERCHTPYACPFLGRCWPVLPEDHVSTLYYGGRRRRELLASGVERLSDLPRGLALTGVQDRQVRACSAGDVVVDEGLDEALRAFDPPLRFLDFETVSPPIPVWQGCRPYDAVPVQFACLAAGERPRLVEHLAVAGEDPRPALARALVSACGTEGTILAYHAAFERRCVEHLLEAVPEESRALEGVWERIEDLLPVVREHVYAPAFRGSFSLKRVLPALLPHLAYDDLEVRDGGVASAELDRLLLADDPRSPEERDAVRKALLAYCRRDVEGLAALHAWLVAHAGDGQPRCG